MHCAAQPGSLALVPPPVDKKWFQQRLREMRRSQAELARFMGVPPAAVSLIFAGRRTVRAQEASDMARFLSVPVNEVLKRLGTTIAISPNAVRVAGILKDRDVVASISDATTDPDTLAIIAPPGLMDAECIIVEASDAAPRFFPGDQIFFYRHDDGDPAELIGKTVVGATADGRLFVKRLAPGSRPGHYTLLSFNPLVMPELDVRVSWAAQIAWVRPV
ncbi:helix-turn-helix domain-containing protein [Brevundimonas sp.]|uniref:helix-turn-helix domain-containing protein n=1 Tax=Brevundimonas sp. TaxID=1871086 RepID=UPI002D3D848D|nr:helix-turn-helix domain-containing protein [Brevundimonas sp.]HYD29210.1 helix-turn-helix domain-containing protein [Brevundimonas sp.]